MKIDDKTVLLCGGFIVWDGLTRPEVITEGKNAGGKKYSLKLVFPPNCADLADLHNLSMQELGASKFRGVLPAGGYAAISRVEPGEFNDFMPGGYVVNLKTYRVPEVFDENGQVLNPMQYSQLVYAGQKVDVLCHCYVYDDKSKGVGVGLDGVRLVLSAQAPRQNFGGGGFNAGAVFGAPMQQQQPTHGYAQPAPASGYQHPQAQQVPASGYQPPAQGYQPPGATGQGYQPPAQGGPAPAQNFNFLNGR